MIRQHAIKLLILTLITIIFSCLFVNCKEEERFSDERMSQLKEIFIALEWNGPEEKAAIMEKYNLTDQSAMEAYENDIRDLSMERDLWQNFLRDISKNFE